MNRIGSRVIVTRLVIAGQALFILWILYNGMDSGWKATSRQWIVYIAMIVLLSLSSILLYSYSRNQRTNISDR